VLTASKPLRPRIPQQPASNDPAPHRATNPPTQACCSNGDAVDHVAISQGHGDPICKPSFGIATSLSPCVLCSGLHSRSKNRGNITRILETSNPRGRSTSTGIILISKDHDRQLENICYFHPRMSQASSRRGLGHDHAIGQCIHGPNFAPDKYRLRRCSRYSDTWLFFLFYIANLMIW
jgi:hypothetical protein